MATGQGVTGNSINIGDGITIVGTVTAVSGKGQGASVTVKTDTGDTITVQGKDCFAPQTSGPALSKSGKPFGVGDPVSISADVINVVGSGKTATVTSATHASQTTVTHQAGTAHVPKKN